MQDQNPIEWAIRPLKKYADFTGRAPRAEYWWFALASTVLGIAFDYLDRLVSQPIIGIYGPLSLALAFVLLVPGVAVTVRRVHDINRNGWWVLLDSWSYLFMVAGLIHASLEEIVKTTTPALLLMLVIFMLVSIVVMLVFTVTRGTEGPNRYGPDPYGPDALEEVFA